MPERLERAELRLVERQRVQELGVEPLDRDRLLRAHDPRERARPGSASMSIRTPRSSRISFVFAGSTFTEAARRR